MSRVCRLERIDNINRFINDVNIVRFQFSACSRLLKSKYLKHDSKVIFKLFLVRAEPGIMSFTHYRDGVPKGIRTPVTAVKGQCPRPLDDGDTKFDYQIVDSVISCRGKNCLAQNLPTYRRLPLLIIFIRQSV